MPPRFPCPWRFPGWCWASADWTTSAPCPRARVAKPNFTSHVSGNHFLSPGDFATIYNVKPLYTAGLDGTGETIAVVGQTEIDAADIDAFRSAAGLPPNNLQLVSVDGTTGFSAGDEVEADLDVEWSGGVAKNATILYVYTGSQFHARTSFNALEFAIDNNLAPVISTSYGNCEANLRFVYRDPASGCATGQYPGPDRHGGRGRLRSRRLRNANCPVCYPRAGRGCSRQYSRSDRAWRQRVHRRRYRTRTGRQSHRRARICLLGAARRVATTKSVQPSPTFRKRRWNDTAASIAAWRAFRHRRRSQHSVLAKPAWQNALTPADGHRDVPDVTLSASPAHDGYSDLFAGGSYVSGLGPRCRWFRDSLETVRWEEHRWARPPSPELSRF